MMRKADVSFEELYNCYKVRFERFAISYIQDRSVAEDIVTDSFVYWWEHRDRVGSKDENPAAYILATIRHKCLNHLRALQVRLRSHNEIRESQSRIVQENIRSLELCDPVHLFAGEVEALVRQSLEELPELTRYIFIDQRLKGKSYRDIAVEYAISERRVETELARALDKLRRRLKDYLPVILVSLVHFSFFTKKIIFFAGNSLAEVFYLCKRLKRLHVRWKKKPYIVFFEEKLLLMSSNA